MPDVSRDPHNAGGYLSAIRPYVEHNETAHSYIREAISVFSTGHDRAAVVLIGIASEALVLELAALLKLKMESAKIKPPEGFRSWKAKSALTSLEFELKKHKMYFGNPLQDQFDSLWGILHTIRLARNESGHPGKILETPVKTAYSNFVLFHGAAKLIYDLRQWIDTTRVYPIPVPG